MEECFIIFCIPKIEDVIDEHNGARVPEGLV